MCVIYILSVHYVRVYVCLCIAIQTLFQFFISNIYTYIHIFTHQFLIKYFKTNKKKPFEFIQDGSFIKLCAIWEHFEG